MVTIRTLIALALVVALSTGAHAADKKVKNPVASRAKVAKSSPMGDTGVHEKGNSRSRTDKGGKQPRSIKFDGIDGESADAAYRVASKGGAPAGWTWFSVEGYKVRGASKAGSPAANRTESVNKNETIAVHGARTRSTQFSWSEVNSGTMAGTAPVPSSGRPAAGQR